MTSTSTQPQKLIRRWTDSDAKRWTSKNDGGRHGISELLSQWTIISYRICSSIQESVNCKFQGLQLTRSQLPLSFLTRGQGRCGGWWEALRPRCCNILARPFLDRLNITRDNCAQVRVCIISLQQEPPVLTGCKHLWHLFVFNEFSE